MLQDVKRFSETLITWIRSNTVEIHRGNGLIPIARVSYGQRRFRSSSHVTTSRGRSRSATSATRGVEMPTKDQRQIVPPTPDEVWKLVDAGEEIGGQGRDMIFVDAFTGLRRNEILELQYTDVDWTNKELVVNKAVSKTKVSDGVQKWEWRIGPPKSRKSNRRVAAAEAVLELLRRLQAEAKIPPVSCSSDLTENGWNPITSTDSSSAE